MKHIVLLALKDGERHTWRPLRDAMRFLRSHLDERIDSDDLRSEIENKWGIILKKESKAVNLTKEFQRKGWIVNTPESEDCIEYVFAPLLAAFVMLTHVCFSVNKHTMRVNSFKEFMKHMTKHQTYIPERLPNTSRRTQTALPTPVPSSHTAATSSSQKSSISPTSQRPRRESAVNVDYTQFYFQEQGQRGSSSTITEGDLSADIPRGRKRKSTQIKQEVIDLEDEASNPRTQKRPRQTTIKQEDVDDVGNAMLLVSDLDNDTEYPASSAQRYETEHPHPRILSSTNTHSD